MSTRDERVPSIVTRAVAEFMEINRDPRVLLTVTRVEITADRSFGTIFITVLPETAEAHSLAASRALLHELQRYIRTHTKLVRIPFFNFEIDKGEKNRQNIERLSQKD